MLWVSSRPGVVPHGHVTPVGIVGCLAGVRGVNARALEGKVHLGELKVKTRARSAVDPFEKWLFELYDGIQVETVRIDKAFLRVTQRTFPDQGGQLTLSPNSPCGYPTACCRSASRWRRRAASACAFRAKGDARRAAHTAPRGSLNSYGPWRRGR
eukprot:6250510-Pyramimonas_sp.AAC.1